MTLSLFEFAPLPRGLKILKAISCLLLPCFVYFLSFHIMLVLFLQPPATAPQYTRGFFIGLTDIPHSSYFQFQHNQFTYEAGIYYGHFSQVLVLIALIFLSILHGINTANIRWFMTGSLAIVCLFLFVGLPRDAIKMMLYLSVTLASAKHYFNQDLQNEPVVKVVVDETPISLEAPTDVPRFGRRKD